MLSYFLCISFYVKDVTLTMQNNKLKTATIAQQSIVYLWRWSMVNTSLFCSCVLLLLSGIHKVIDYDRRVIHALIYSDVVFFSFPCVDTNEKAISWPINMMVYMIEGQVNQKVWMNKVAKIQKKIISRYNHKLWLC